MGRSIALRCLSDLSLHLNHPLDRILTCDFEEIFNTFLDHNDSLSLDLISRFPLELFLPNLDPPPKISGMLEIALFSLVDYDLDLADIPEYFVKRIITGLYYVDQTRKTKLLDALLSSKKASGIRVQVTGFLYSRILVMVHNKKCQLPVWMPKVNL